MNFSIFFLTMVQCYYWSCVSKANFIIKKYRCVFGMSAEKQWRHNERDGVSNYQPHHCLLNRLIRRRSKKTSKLRLTVRGIHRWIPRNVTRKMFPFDDIIMEYSSKVHTRWGKELSRFIKGVVCVKCHSNKIALAKLYFKDRVNLFYIFNFNHDSNYMRRPQRDYRPDGLTESINHK